MLGFHLEVMGCQLNQLDGARLRELLLARGFVEVPKEQADVVFLLTCVVRAKPETKALELVRWARKRGKRVAVLGCLGPLRAARLRELGAEVYPSWEYEKLLRKLGVEGELLGGMVAPHRAYLRIGEGCNNFCAYCIVPYVRGRERYFSLGEILREARRLAGEGALELTLLAQNIDSYWDGKHRFLELLAAIHDETPIPMIKATTHHPRDLDLRIIEVFKPRPRLSRWFHMPLQTGSDRLLALMGRGYTLAEWREKAQALKEAFPEAQISTDIMVGLPTETPSDFEATLRAVEELPLDQVYMFYYNERPGTRAAGMEQVPLPERKARLKLLTQVATEAMRRRRKGFLGREMRVLTLGGVEAISHEDFRVILEREHPPGLILRGRVVALRGLVPVLGEIKNQEGAHDNLEKIAKNF